MALVPSGTPAKRSQNTGPSKLTCVPRGRPGASLCRALLCSPHLPSSQGASPQEMRLLEMPPQREWGSSLRPRPAMQLAALRLNGP